MDASPHATPDHPTPPAAPEAPPETPTIRRGRRGLGRLGRNRLIALTVLLPCLSILLLAAWLRPDPAGMGTHTQIGLAPCGFKAATGLPCISCGMTTSFAHAANGDLLTAFTTQPMGTLLALTTAALVWVSGYAAVSGMSLAPLGRWLGQGWVVIALLSLAGAAWAYTLTRHLLGS